MTAICSNTTNYVIGCRSKENSLVLKTETYYSLAVFLISEFLWNSVCLKHTSLVVFLYISLNI